MTTSEHHIRLLNIANNNSDYKHDMTKFSDNLLPLLPVKITEALVSLGDGINEGKKIAVKKLLDIIDKMQSHYMSIDIHINNNIIFLTDFINDESKNSLEQILYAKKLMKKLCKNKILSKKIIQGFQDLSEDYEELFFSLG